MKRGGVQGGGGGRGAGVSEWGRFGRVDWIFLAYPQSNSPVRQRLGSARAVGIFLCIQISSKKVYLEMKSFQIITLTFKQLPL